jgi:ankyrin repeat protein
VCCGYAKAEGVAALLELGNKPDLVDNFGMNALHTAADCAEIDVLPLLLADENGKACMNVQDADGCTPLMYAAWANRKENVIALMRAGADTSIAAADGKTALDMAKEMKNKESIDILTNGPPPEEEPQEGEGA